MSGFDEARDDVPWEAGPGGVPWEAGPGGVPWEAGPGGVAGDWELAAAAIELAVLRRTAGALPTLPAELAARIGRDAPMHLPRADRIESRPAPASLASRNVRSGGRPWVAAAGWLTAACLAGLLCWRWSGPPRIAAPAVGPIAPPEVALSPAELRDRLLAEDPEAVTVAWKKATDDPAVVAGKVDLERPGGLGDVVWSPGRQQGFMRFRGLAANDPSKAQYQLWIFDAERNEAHPVDGGVFDVPSKADGEDGEVVVKIDPRLPISKATAFAITVERPGGVVVSSRERLPLLAAVN